MVEFATLWDMVQNFQLNAEEDSIRWRWTPNGAYKAKSAYLAQLQGTYPSLEEMAIHISMHCCYAKEIWFLVSNWMGPGASILCGADGNLYNAADGDIYDWWNRVLEPLNANQRCSVAAIVMYTIWNIWKERNPRIFDNSSLRLDQWQRWGDSAALRRQPARTDDTRARAVQEQRARALAAARAVWERRARAVQEQWARALAAAGLDGRLGAAGASLDGQAE
uniref:Uncharacterized protein n=1 Tax=Setaria italica TaxID=4555 RepID=K3ZL48_SETIT